jgi:hypothetical protein
MKRRLLAAFGALLLVTLACASGGTPAPVPTLAYDPYALGRTLYGFFPSPPEATLQSVMDTYQAISEHGDVVLLQQNIPWADLVLDRNAESQAITDIRNQYILARQRGLEIIFVVDPLNGLNRREFQGLPADWQASFFNPDVRAAYQNFTLRIVQEFQPRYLGLASEINTYQDTHPEDFPAFLSLYRETYALIKDQAPDTQVFVTFQWEELNNLIPTVAQGDLFAPNWDQVEQFEPNLDLWVISSYPFIIFPTGADIPPDYYTPLLARTAKDLAVAEGGYTSEPVGSFPGAEQSQVDYLEAIHDQIGGERLAFWIYLLINDFDLDSYASIMEDQGQGDDISTLGMFASVGLTTAGRDPKPALATWDSFRR